MCAGSPSSGRRRSASAARHFSASPGRGTTPRPACVSSTGAYRKHTSSRRVSSSLCRRSSRSPSPTCTCSPPRTTRRRPTSPRASRPAYDRNDTLQTSSSASSSSSPGCRGVCCSWLNRCGRGRGERTLSGASDHRQPSTSSSCGWPSPTPSGSSSSTFSWTTTSGSG